MSTVLWITAAAGAAFALGWHLRAAHGEHLARWATTRLVMPALRHTSTVCRWIERHRRQERPGGPISVVVAPRPIPPVSGGTQPPRWGARCMVTGCGRPFSRTTERYGPDFGYCEAHAHAIDEHSAEWDTTARGGA